MKIVQLPQILGALDEDTALAAVESSFRRCSAGETQVAEVGHLGFTARRLSREVGAHRGRRCVRRQSGQSGQTGTGSGDSGRGRVIVDSLMQCVAHGEAGWAVRAGLIDAASLIELGSLLASPVSFGQDEIVVADLTGVAVQDVAIAKSVWLRLT